MRPYQAAQTTPHSIPHPHHAFPHSAFRIPHFHVPHSAFRISHFRISAFPHFRISASGIRHPASGIRRTKP